MHTPAPLPPEYIERITELYDEATVAQLVACAAVRRPTTFRANTLVTTAEKLADSLRAKGYELEQQDWYPDAFILRNKGLRDLEQEEEYQTGQLYVQGLSSMLPALVLAPQPGESVLDIAAAPGSKTTQMAAQMQNEGMILANDTSRVRLYKLQANLEKQHVSCVTIRHGLGEKLWQEFPAVFDKALVDVPCSMEGRFLTTKPKTLQNWSEKNVKQLARRQQHLLHSAFSATEVGGTLVYSTCTMSPEENEGVIQWLLQREAGNVSVEPIELAGEFWHEPVAEWRGTTYDSQVQHTRRILTSENFEGFFVAKLRRIG